MRKKDVVEVTIGKEIDIPSKKKEVELSSEQKLALEKDEKVPINEMQRKEDGTSEALVSSDLEKTKPNYDFPDNPEQTMEFKMPNKVKGVELSEENKQSLQAGEKVFLTGMIAASGKLFDAYVSIDTENKKLAFDFPENPEQTQEFRMPKAVKGVELSEENKQKLEAGERIFLEGMTSAKGTLFSANVYVDKEKRTLAFVFPEKEKKMQEQNEAPRETPLEKPITGKETEIPSEIKGVTLSEEQKLALEKGEKVPISGMQRKGGGTFAALVSWDLEKAKPNYDFPDNQEQTMEFNMPNKVKGVELSEENKQSLQAGEKVFLTGMIAASGKLFDAYVSIDIENKKLTFDFPENPEQTQEFSMPKTVKGVELSEENKQKLEAGERIFLEGMTSTKGTLFSANVYVNKEKGTLAFVFPEKEKKIQEQKEAPRETPLEKPIKKNGVKM